MSETRTLAWHQVEPRRRYNTEHNGRRYSLVYHGRGAVGPVLDVGWYIEGGLDGKGHEFMARRLQDAVNAATDAILKRDTEKES